MADKIEKSGYTFGSTGFLPQEEMLEIGKKKKKLITRQAVTDPH